MSVFFVKHSQGTLEVKVTQNILQWLLLNTLFLKGLTHCQNIPFHYQSQIQLRIEEVCVPRHKTRLMAVSEWSLVHASIHSLPLTFTCIYYCIYESELLELFEECFVMPTYCLGDMGLTNQFIGAVIILWVAPVTKWQSN